MLQNLHKYENIDKLRMSISVKKGFICAFSWLLYPDPCCQCRSGSNNSYVCSSFRTLLYRWPSNMFLRKVPEINFSAFFVPVPWTGIQFARKLFDGTVKGNTNYLSALSNYDKLFWRLLPVHFQQTFCLYLVGPSI